MDFSLSFLLKDKRTVWVDVIYYLAISLLVASVFSWVIFLVKNYDLKKQVLAESTKLATVGTDDQKKYEDYVMGYQKKINDFNELFKNHEFASNIFVFMEKHTMPEIWFKQFTLDEKSGKIQMTGEAENMEAFSRQVADLEKSEYVRSVNVLNSSEGTFSKINFNLDLTLDQKIFGYVAAETGQQSPVTQTTSQ
jgi:hypothetical protein